MYVAAGGTTPGGENPSDVTEVYLPSGARGCAPQPATHANRTSTPKFREAGLEGSSSFNPTAIQVGPDARVYVAQQSGLIKAYTVVRRSGRYAVIETEEIDDIKRIPNHDDDGSSVSDLPSILDVVTGKLGL